MVVLSLLLICCSLLFCGCSVYCCALLCVSASFAIILMGKRELVAFFSMSSWCLEITVWLFFTVLWVCLQFVIVVFPDQTLLLFKRNIVNNPLQMCCFVSKLKFFFLWIVSMCKLLRITHKLYIKPFRLYSVCE